MTKGLLVAAVVFCVASVASAAQLAHVFTSNMVLQRDMKICIWGTGTVSEGVTVAFAGQKKTTQVTVDGTWKLHLDPVKASSTPQVLVVMGDKGAGSTIDNVLVGDVWLFSGAGHERTMEQLGHGTPKLLPKAQHALVRVLRPNKYRSLYPVSDITADCRWIEVSPTSIARYNTNWYFGKHLHELTKVPVGIILATKRSEDARDYFAWNNSPSDKRLRAMNETIAEKLPHDIAHVKRWLASMKNYTAGDAIEILPFPSYIPYEYYGQNPSFANKNHPYRRSPSGIYNSMVSPFRLATIRGIVFFNELSGRCTLPANTFSQIVPTWRKQFGQQQLPFILPAPQNTKYSKRFRDATEKLGEMPFVQSVSGDTLTFVGLDGGEYWKQLAQIANKMPLYQQDVSKACAALPKAKKTQVVDARLKLRTSHIFSSNMVLQRNVPITIWGWTSEPGQSITLECAGQRTTAISDEKCRWEVQLKPLATSTTPQTMTIVSGSETLVYNNILVGEVWVNSGQSNAGFAMAATLSYKDEVSKELNSSIRYLYNTKVTSVLPLKNNYPNGWNVLNKTTLKNISGQGYHFAKEVATTLGVPVGIIEANMGGAHIVRFCNADALKGNAKLATLHNNLIDTTEAAQHDIPELISSLTRWVEGAEKNAHLQRPMPPFPIDMSPFKPFYSGYQNHMSERGATLYNSLIGPMKGAAFKGVLWNQGEADRSPPMLNLYDKLNHEMVTHWRSRFGNDFPFYFVGMPAMKNQPGLLPFWEMQLAVAKNLPRCGMTVSNDISESEASFGRAIHPPNKKDVGKRLALLALSRTYGKDMPVDSSPLMNQVVRRDHKMIVTFSSCGTGLTTRDGKQPDCWEISGDNKTFVAAKAVISNDTVIVAAEGIATPTAVRLGWKSNSNCNLINSAGLPAFPFRFKVE